MGLFSLKTSSSLFQMGLVFNTSPSAPIISMHEKHSASFRIPARDRVLGIGKYRGKMLGSLPSRYLKWVSKNLRAGDTEEWARLADEVLEDPVYRDRIEWEMAEKILNGSTASPRTTGSNAVSELLEISERFGWDNEDKQGWREIDFGLLGTSKGRRIPRLAAAEAVAEKKKNALEGEEEEETKVEHVHGKRRERRERMRRRRLQTNDGGGEKAHHGEEEGEEGDDVQQMRTGSTPFPGRQALLDKLLLHRRPHYSSS